MNGTMTGSMIGESIGSYVIERQLGEGGMGEVYLAAHRRISRRAAVKFLRPEYSRDADVLGRFFNEARATSLIEHPNIVEIIDCDVHPNGRAFIVMEYLRGESLSSALKRLGSLQHDRGAVYGIFLQIASALALAHAKGIVHRDLKPDNIFLTEGTPGSGLPTVKILDFGIAKLASSQMAPMTQTRTGSLLGTPLYMSPEQCRGSSQVDHRSDVYSLGCVLYETLTGRPPFLKETPGDLIVAHVCEVPLSPRQLGVSLPPALEGGLTGMLAKDAQDRPPSMASVEAILREAAHEEGLPRPSFVLVSPPEATETPPAPSAPTIPTPQPQSRPQPHPFGAAHLSRPVSPADRPSVSPAGGQVAAVGQTAALGTARSTTFSRTAGEAMRRAGREGVESVARSVSRPSRLPLLLGLGCAVVALGGGGLYLVRRPSEGDPSAGAGQRKEGREGTRHAPVASEHGAETVSDEPGATPARRPSRESAAASTIRVDVREAPPSLTVTVDGATTAVPFMLTRDGRAHELRFEAPGYQPLVRTIEAREDLEVPLGSMAAVHQAARPVSHKRDRHAGKPTSGRHNGNDGPASPSPQTDQAEKPPVRGSHLPNAITDL